MIVALIVLAVALVALLAYAELVVAEGVHLGPRVVTWLYDITANRYNRIKQFDPAYEEWFLGEPLAQALSHIPVPLVLDVATGTGRLPITLLPQPSFHGRVIGLDSSRAMLTLAARDTQAFADRVTLIWQAINRLPVEADTFDAVTCLEALEFLPNTRRVLIEIIRVLRPGGVLLATNRVSVWAKFLIGHTQSRAEFEALLASLGMTGIHTQTWQMEYDLVWAIKPGHAIRIEDKPLAEILRCPHCDVVLKPSDRAYTCQMCNRTFHVAPDGVIEMMRSRKEESP